MKGYIWALVSGTCTGLTVAVGKMAAVELSAAMYVFLMSFISFLLMYFWRGTTIGWRLQRVKVDVLRLLFLQVVFSAIALWAFWEGTRQINTGVASFAARTELIFVLIASRWIFRERVGLFGVIGAILIAVGATLMALRLQGEGDLMSVSNSSSDMYGLSVVVFSGLGFAASECFSKPLAHKIEASALVIWRCLCLATIFGIAVLLDEGPSSFLTVTGENLLAIGLAALLGPVLARLTFMWSLQRIELGESYLICQVEPVITALCAWVLIGEALSPSDLIGATLILGGCIIVAAPVQHRIEKLLCKVRLMKEEGCGTRAMSVDS